MWVNPTGDGDLAPAIGATVRVCSVGATGSPCTPLATLYTDQTLSTVQPTNPLTTDSFGNFTICVGVSTVYLETTNKGVVKVQPTYLVAAGGGTTGGGGVVLAAVSVNPASVQGGTNTVGTVTLSGPAPTTGGAVVALLSSNPSAAQVPGNITVPAGDTAASFNVTTSTVLSNTQVTLTGTFVTTEAVNLSVTTPGPPPTPIYGGVGIAGATSGSLTGTSVTLNNGVVLPQLQTTGEQVGQSWSFTPNNQVVYLLLIGGAHTFTDALTGLPFAMNPPITMSIGGVTMYLYQSTNALFGAYQPRVQS